MSDEEGSTKGDRPASPPPREPTPAEALLAQQTALLNSMGPKIGGTAAFSHLYGNKTFDGFSKRTNSLHSESTTDWLEDSGPPNTEESGQRIFAAHDTFKGVFALFSNRYTMIRLRASMESDATLDVREWMRAETDRCLRTGAWVCARRRRHAIRVSVVRKSGMNKWRLVMESGSKVCKRGQFACELEDAGEKSNTWGRGPTRAKLPTEDNQAAVADAEPLRLQEPLADAAHETPVLLDLTDLKLGARYITSEANERNQLGQPSVRTARRGRTQAAGVKVRRHGAWWPPIGRGQMWFQQQAALADEAVIKPRCRDLFTPVGYYLQQAKQEAAATQQPKPEYGSKARRKGGLGDSSLADLAVKMQSAAPEDTTVSNYRPNEEAFMQFCVTEGRSWLPATEAFMQFCVTEGRSWLPATEAFMQFCVTEGRSWLPATEAKAQQAGKQEEELAVRTWLPTRYVSVVHAPRLGLHPVGRAEAEMLSACTCMVFAFVYFGRLNTGVSMLWDHNRVAASFVWLHRFGGGIVSVVLHKE
ncbi:hypothetical protein CYMTET_35520 [Cymbomonas tetramitiformis]|uniref:Uncharacterized protein n=1 Tax=Cymbomonas tetramitiformis TaxID=36881 RepID=A0AAE0F8Y0_9CHLO|nr:hypothetical protein CYMTET_35520 [Cymbomonas tetramitiformis]